MPRSRRRSATLRRLIESSPDAIIATDKNGIVVLFNEGAETLLGYRAEEVIGRPTIELYDSEERAKDVLIEMRKRGGTASGYESVLKAKGRAKRSGADLGLGPARQGRPGSRHGRLRHRSPSAQA